LIILSLDTATDVATSCLSVDGAVVGETASRGRSRSAQHVLEDVRGLLQRGPVDLGEVSAIVVGRGPGTFTGLRIGIATARGLGMALGIPVRGVSTLDALLQGDGVRVACIDARRGEVFAAGAGIEPQAVTPELLAAMLPVGATVAGDGAVLYRQWLTEAVVPPDDSPLHVPWARHHAALIDVAVDAEPLYLRAPDAERNLATAAARRAAV
jgi:tRNA threonylcarbamoyl adenosine modification protein YeaZ